VQTGAFIRGHGARCLAAPALLPKARPGTATIPDEGRWHWTELSRQLFHLPITALCERIWRRPGESDEKDVGRMVALLQEGGATGNSRAVPGVQGQNDIAASLFTQRATAFARHRPDDGRHVHRRRRPSSERGGVYGQVADPADEELGDGGAR
jgi:hypothetical protein